MTNLIQQDPFLLSGCAQRVRACAACFIAVFAALCTPAHAAPADMAPDERPLLQIRTEGHADGIGFSARHAAIQDAQREAVRSVLSAHLATGAVEPLSPMLQQAPSYVTRYDLLRHDTLNDATRVELDCWVDERRLNYDLAAIMLPRLPTPPTVLLVIAEQLPADSTLAVPDFGAAETALAERMEKQKLQTVSATKLDGKYSQKELLSAIDGDVEVGKAFALEQETSAVILGTAQVTTERGAEATNLLKNTATVALRIFRTSDGRLTDSISTTAVVNGADAMEAGELAVRDACAKIAGDAVVAAVIATLGATVADAVEVTVANPGDEDTFLSIQAALEAAPGVIEVERVYFSETTARLRVDYDGPMSTLTDYLNAQVYNGHNAQVRRTVERTIELEILR